MAEFQSHTEDTKKSKLDQFYTHPDIATKCMKYLLEYFESIKFNYNNCIWLEPSAGRGVFIDEAKQNGIKNVVGMDIEPYRDDIEKKDFINFIPQYDFGTQVVVFGNPPFGLRGDLAKRFIQKSLMFAEYVAFIVPQSAYQYHKEHIVGKLEFGYIPYIYPNGEIQKVKGTDFIILQKYPKETATCNEFVEIKHIVIQRFEYENQEAVENKIDKLNAYYDFFISDSRYPSEPFVISKTIRDFRPYSRKKWTEMSGIKIVAKDEKVREELREWIMMHDWEALVESNVNGSVNLNAYKLRKAFISDGWIDSKPNTLL